MKNIENQEPWTMLKMGLIEPQLEQCKKYGFRLYAYRQGKNSIDLANILMKKSYTWKEDTLHLREDILHFIEDAKKCIALADLFTFMVSLGLIEDV